MDPVTVKLVQLIFAELLGAVLCFLGIYLSYKGLSGALTILVKAPGITAKLTNAAPGLVITIIGLIVVFRSLDTDMLIVRKPNDPKLILSTWLKNSSSIHDKMTYAQVTDAIVGTEEDTFFKPKTFKVENDTTLSKLAEIEYGDASFWRLVAAINKDQGLYILSKATASTLINKGKYIEIWHPSIYNKMPQQQRIRIGAINQTAAYDEMLGRIKSGEEFNFSLLSDEFKKRELELSYMRVDSDNIKNLREASLSYYGNPKYWPLVAWSSPGVFGKNDSEDTPLPRDKAVHAVKFIGWPR